MSAKLLLPSHLLVRTYLHMVRVTLISETRINTVLYSAIKTVCGGAEDDDPELAPEHCAGHTPDSVVKTAIVLWGRLEVLCWCRGLQTELGAAEGCKT